MTFLLYALGLWFVFVLMGAPLVVLVETAAADLVPDIPNKWARNACEWTIQAAALTYFLVAFAPLAWMVHLYYFIVDEWKKLAPTKDRGKRRDSK